MNIKFHKVKISGIMRAFLWIANHFMGVKPCIESKKEMNVNY